MTKRLNISFDSDLLEAISSDFDLRAPNKEALRKLVFTLDLRVPAVSRHPR